MESTHISNAFFALAGLEPPEREHVFALPRKWRFDFAWPARLLALEVDGGVWTGGRHVRGKGFEADCIKVCEAAARGWRVMRCTPKMIEDGRLLDLLERAARLAD